MVSLSTIVVTVKLMTSLYKIGFILLLNIITSLGVVGVSPEQISSLVQPKVKFINRKNKNIFLIIIKYFFSLKAQRFQHEKFAETYLPLGFW
jgi:hypothetical protein